MKGEAALGAAEASSAGRRPLDPMAKPFLGLGIVRVASSFKVFSGALRVRSKVLRCTHCDPLFVLEPVPFGEVRGAQQRAERRQCSVPRPHTPNLSFQDPTARCVSDGPIEFSARPSDPMRL